MKNVINKELVIYIYKGLTFIVNYFVFVFIYSFVNPGLLEINRISILTFFVYTLTMMILLPVYQSFDIGKRKTLPVIFSTSIVYFLALITIYLVQVIMTVGFENYPGVFIKSLFLLAIIYIIQITFLYQFSNYGNILYFKLYEPVRTLIVYDDNEYLDKIIHYVKSHDKQFNLINISQYSKSSIIDYDEFSVLFLVGIKSNIRYKIQEECFANSIDLFYTSSVTDIISGITKSTVIDDVLMIESTAIRLTLAQSILKRTMDIIFSIISLLFLTPLIVIISVSIKLDDGGPIFYRQERITLNGKVFKIIKFRSMVADSGYAPAKVNDPRITKVGVFIRKFRIDEIPQLVNILKGEMSIVGPRPESKVMADEIQKNMPDFSYRLKVKAGLTGYAQIFGKYNTTASQKIILDLKYIVNYSIINDIKLIFQTVNVLFNSSESTEGYTDNL